MKRCMTGPSTGAQGHAFRDPSFPWAPVKSDVVHLLKISNSMFFESNPLVIVLLFLLLGSAANADTSATTEERLKSCNPTVAISAAEEVSKGQEHLQEPVLLLKAASVFYQYGRKEDAVFWYYAGHLRTRQQMAVDKGRGRDGFIEVVSTIGLHISTYAQSDVTRLNAVLAKVLEWDAETANFYIDKATSDQLKNEIGELYAEYDAFKTRLSTEKSFIESQHKNAALQLNRMYEVQFGSRCRKN